MHTVEARWYVKPGCEKKAAAAIRRLVKAVEANEPGTLTYLVHWNDAGSKPPPAAGEVVFVEVYKSMKAFEAHLNGSAFQKFLKKSGDLFVSNFDEAAGPFMLTATLDRIAGFERACR